MWIKSLNCPAFALYFPESGKERNDQLVHRRAGLRHDLVGGDLRGPALGREGPGRARAGPRHERAREADDRAQAAGQPYHDREYGFPVADEAILFERLILEINQAGLSWELMLKKRANFHAAFEGFEVDRVAAYGAAERARLLADAGIIRNRLKVDAAIENARRIQALRRSHGGFAAWLEAHHPRPKDDWVKLFKETFKFTGGDRGPRMTG
jgi:DNA-3-methyladenine glycosylase I